jgi:hypothetical protein
MTAFQRFIADLVERYGTSMSIAEAIGMSRSAFARGVKHEGTLGDDNVLIPVEIVGEDQRTRMDSQKTRQNARLRHLAQTSWV